MIRFLKDGRCFRPSVPEALVLIFGSTDTYLPILPACAESYKLQPLPFSKPRHPVPKRNPKALQSGRPRSSNTVFALFPFFLAVDPQPIRLRLVGPSAAANRDTRRPPMEFGTHARRKISMGGRLSKGYTAAMPAKPIPRQPPPRPRIQIQGFNSKPRENTCSANR